MLALLVATAVGSAGRFVLFTVEVFGDDGFGEGAVAPKLGFLGYGVYDDYGGFGLVSDDGVVGAFVAHREGDVVGGTAGVDVVEFFEGLAFGLEVDIEGEALVLGVVLVDFFVTEEELGNPGAFSLGVLVFFWRALGFWRRDVGDFGAASAEELEDGVGLYCTVQVLLGVEAKWGLVAGVDLGRSPPTRGGVLLGLDAGGCEEREQQKREGQGHRNEGWGSAWH